VRRIRISRPSPAMLVAVAALFVALGGTATAALVITGRNVRNGSLSGHDIKNGTIRGGDVRNNSLTAHDIRGRLQGPAGTAKAYGHVLAGGRIDVFRSKAIARVSRPAPGYYCFYLSFPAQSISATLDAQRSRGVDLAKGTLYRDDSHGDKCAGAESASVRTIDTGGKHPGYRNADFYVLFN
jgi:hypothetical protein